MLLSRRHSVIAGAGALAALTSRARRSFAADDMLHIGVIVSMTGVSARVGKYVRLGVEIARDQINAAGGVNGRKIELVLRDDKSDPRVAVEAARELNGLGINLLAGVPLTAMATAVGGIAQSIDAVVVTTGSISDSLSHELFQKNVFMVAGNNYMRSRAAAGVMAQRYPNVKVWGGIIPDIAIGHASWAVFSNAIKNFYHDVAKKDVTIVDPIVTKYGSTDFKNQIASLMASPVEGLFTILQGSDAITFFQQAKSLGLDKKLKVIADNSVDLDLADVLKSKLPEVIWGVSHSYYGAFAKSKVNDEFVRLATSRSGDSYVSSLSCVADTGIRAYAAAVAASKGTETKSVISALETVTVDTLVGPFRFRKEDHQGLAPIDVVHMVPQNTTQGWKVTEYVHFPPEKSINPATPGVELKL